MTFNHRPALSTDPDTSTEMLELIAKVTASLSDRIDAQGKTLEEIRHLGRSTAQIIDQIPGTIDDVKAEERDRLDAEHHRDRCKWRIWRRSAFFAVPIIVLLLVLILPTLLARHPLTCETMAGTWHVEDGMAYCFFRKDAS